MQMIFETFARWHKARAMMFAQEKRKKYFEHYVYTVQDTLKRFKESW